MPTVSRFLGYFSIVHWSPEMTTSDAAVLYELGQPLRLESLTFPQLKPGQALVDVRFSGICHTQLSEVRGRRGSDPFLPHCLGHEASGVVLEVGAGVTKVVTGDHVVLSWIKGSGLEVKSEGYESESGGRVNSGPIATFMRQTITCENRLTPIPKEMPLREAALLGCAFPTGAGIVRRAGQARDGSSLAVFGTGGIGLSVIVAARLVRAKTVIAVDIHDHKLELARSVGASHVVNARRVDPLSAIQEITRGQGVDVAVEAAGTRGTMEAAFAATTVAGGVCVLAGNLPKGERIAIDPFDLIRGKRLVGTVGGESDMDRDIPEYVDRYLAGSLDLGPLISHVYSLADINLAMDAIEAGKVARAIIDMNL